MARRGPSFSFGFDEASKRTLRMVKEWPKRTKAMQQEFTYDAAEAVRKDITQRLPAGQEYKTYRDQLEVAEIDGLPSDTSGHIVHVPVKARDVRKSDSRQTLIYVRQRQNNRSRSRRIAVLEKYGPWPVDMLPFKPSSKEAKVVSRSVPDREVTAIRKRLERRRSRWYSALVAAGAAEKKRGAKTKRSGRLRAVPDVAFQALRLEFGMGGSKARAHWRPSILGFARDALPKMARQKGKFDKAMTEPKNTEWLGWPHRSKGRIRASELKKYSEFQDRLGLRFGGWG